MNQMKRKRKIMTYFKIDEKNEIYYEYVPPRGNGFTFVFVNALTGNTTAWNGTVGENVVKEGNGYLAYNFRGQVHSKFDNNIDLNTDVIVEDLIALTNYVNPKKIVLVGLSIGGLYASMAVERGIDAQGLILINTLRKPNDRLNWINNAMVNAAKVGGPALIMDMGMPVIASPEFLKKMEDKALEPENYKPLSEDEGIFKLMKGSLTANWSFDWSIIKIPTLVMTGHFDKMFRIPEDVESLSKSISNVHRIELPECGHLIPLEKPESFAENINKFVKQLN